MRAPVPIPIPQSRKPPEPSRSLTRRVSISQSPPARLKRLSMALIRGLLAADYSLGRRPVDVVAPSRKHHPVFGPFFDEKPSGDARQQTDRPPCPYHSTSRHHRTTKHRRVRRYGNQKATAKQSRRRSGPFCMKTHSRQAHQHPTG
jgi:hypothetical protein